MHLVQEHRLPIDKCKEQEAKLMKQGWKSLSEPAICVTKAKSGKGFYSGGVAIIAPMWVDLRAPQKVNATVEKGRLLSAALRGVGIGELVIYSVYLEDGSSAAVKTRNKARLASVIQHWNGSVSEVRQWLNDYDLKAEVINNYVGLYI